MKNLQGLAEARLAMDQLVTHRFAARYDTPCLDSYLDHIDRVSTAHLSVQARRRVISIAGKQRRRAEVYLDPDSPQTLLVGVPVNNPHNPEAEAVAVLEAGVWIDLLETGAHGAWYFNHKGRPTGGQVVVKPPMRCSGLIDMVAIARLITNAKAGQQAKTSDKNPLNLRRSNLYLVGSPERADTRAGTAKADARAEVIAGKSLQASLAGMQYDIPNHA